MLIEDTLNNLIEYAYTGVFFVDERVIPEDGDLLKEDEETEGNGDTETVVLETPCGIQQAAKMFTNGAIVADYNVYFPRTDNLAPLPVRNGMSFRCEDYPIPIQGMVIGIEAGQLGVKVQIKMPGV